MPQRYGKIIYFCYFCSKKITCTGKISIENALGFVKSVTFALV